MLILTVQLVLPSNNVALKNWSGPARLSTGPADWPGDQVSVRTGRWNERGRKGGAESAVNRKVLQESEEKWCKTNGAFRSS